MTQEVATIPTELKPRDLRPRPLLVDVVVRLAKEKKLGFWGGLVPILLMIAFAAAAPLIAQAPPDQQNGDILLKAPSLHHLFGTDEYGRDVLARVAYGARISLWVGFASVFLGIGAATIVGLASGLGGWLDFVVQRCVDVLMAFPSFILILLIASILGAGERNTIIAIAIFLLAAPSRVIRGQVITVKANAYIEAARATGCSPLRVIGRHILPNVLDVIVVIMSINIAFAIVTEAALSFIGLGVPPPTADWGSMVSGTETGYLVRAPWIMIAAATALAITVYAFNMLGDALRDILDPRLRSL